MARILRFDIFHYSIFRWKMLQYLQADTVLLENHRREKRHEGQGKGREATKY